MKPKQEILHGWGHTPVAECAVWRPEKRREPESLVRGTPAVIARGLGRSYGDASLQPAGVIRTDRLDHILDFDDQHGVVRVQAGASLADLMDFFIPRGWLPPVLPGTRFVTAGGAFACNVHGKNQFRDGDFAEHVRSIRLLTANGNSIECSPTEQADLFWATAGGMGMTGIIEELTIVLRPINSASLKTTAFRVDSIEDMVSAFENYQNVSDYMVGWIDHMATGKHLGRGVFEAASHLSVAEGGQALRDWQPLAQRLSVPCFLPPFVLNRYVMALYNRWRFRKYDVARQSETVGFNGFFHPLDAIGHWYRLYGKRGFFQYQCLIPDARNTAGTLREFLAALHRERLFSYLAVIKRHCEGKGLMTFSSPGYSIALDFPNTPRVRVLVPEINQWVAECGGRVYLAKDALLSTAHFNRMYGDRTEQWRSILHEADPKARFTSLMSERLEWKPWRGSHA